jgi:CDP-glucose 4,6-dehydratase
MSDQSPWRGRRVFVTGATGIVGSWLVPELLSQGASVVVLIRDWDPQTELVRSGCIQRTSVVQGALEDYNVVERAINEHDIDTVFHLGAQTIVGTALRSPLPTFEANIRGSYNLLEACRIHKSLVKRVVIASSDKAYGDSAVLPYTEDMPLAGRHPYDVSKSCTDLLATTYSHTYGTPVAIVRCGNIYGGGDLNWSRIVPGTIRSCLNEERPIIRSDGKFLRDYIYVKDVVAAYLAVAMALDKRDMHEHAYNISPERAVTVLDIVNEIQKLLNATHLEPDIRNEARSEIRDQYLSCTRATEVLKWAPRFTLTDGLRETISWYRGFLA